MFLYWLASENRYVHRQSDIPKGVNSERVDVPTDTAGLMAYLNELVQAKTHDTGYADDAPVVPNNPAPEAPATLYAAEEQVVEAEADMSASATLSRMDNPKLSVDRIIDGIEHMKGMHALKRVSGAVAMRFMELSK